MQMGGETVAGAVVDGFFQFGRDQVERLIPADGFPHRILTGPFFRVRAFQRLLESFRVVMPHDGGVAFRAKFAFVRRIRRIALDLVYDSVIRDVHYGAAGMQAHLAG